MSEKERKFDALKRVFDGKNSDTVKMIKFYLIFNHDVYTEEEIRVKWDEVNEA